MFELNELPKQKIKIYGKEFEITKPTVKQLKTLSQKIDGMKTGEAAAQATDEMIQFVSQLGIPGDILEELPGEHFNALVEFIVGSKKN